MRKFLSRITNPSVPTAIFMAVGSLLLWLPTLLSASYELVEITVYLTELFHFELNYVWLVWLTMALTLLNGILLSVLFRHLDIVYRFTLLPTAVYIFLISANPILHAALISQISTLLSLWLLFLLSSIFKNRHAVEYSFHIGLVFSMLFCLMPVLVLLLPALWIAYAIMQAFSMRMLWASLVGLVAGLVVMISASVFWLGSPEGIDVYRELFQDPFQDFSSNLPFLGYLLLLLLLVIIYWFSFRSNAYNYTLRTRTAFATIVFLCLILTPFLSLHTTLSISFIGFWLSLFSVIHVSFFTTRQGIFPLLLLIILLVVHLGFYCFFVWPVFWGNFI